MWLLSSVTTAPRKESTKAGRSLCSRQSQLLCRKINPTEQNNKAKPLEVL